jgi:hypothetical protein
LGLTTAEVEAASEAAVPLPEDVGTATTGLGWALEELSSAEEVAAARAVVECFVLEAWEEDSWEDEALSARLCAVSWLLLL